jgi:hypothetical protein
MGVEGGGFKFVVSIRLSLTTGSEKLCYLKWK